MIYVLYGKDQSLIKENLNKLYSKYKEDTDFAEFVDTNIPIADLTSALCQMPMFADKFVVYVSINRAQFIRLKDYFKPAPDVILILNINFKPSEEDLKSIKDYELINCFMPKGRDLTIWAKKKAASFGLSLDKDDLKMLTLTFSELKELSDVFYMLSLLPVFDRQIFISEISSSRQKFLWGMLISLLKKDKKSFFNDFSEQFSQNLDLTSAQFYAKTMGGLIFCLKAWQDGSLPDWVDAQLSNFNDKKDLIIPKVHIIIMESILSSRKDNSIVLALEKLSTLFK